jgi:hypothetical protein
MDNKVKSWFSVQIFRIHFHYLTYNKVNTNCTYEMGARGSVVG